jgi:uncharacterized transporter YbjL
MNPTFDRYYHQLGRGTLVLLVSTIAMYGAVYLCAKLGLQQGVVSLTGAAHSLAYACAVVAIVYFLATVASALIRWWERGHPSGGSNPS